MATHVHSHVRPRRAAFLLSLAVLAPSSPALAQSLPTASWVRLRCGAVPMADAQGDEPDAPGPRDIVGGGADPAGFRAVDDDFLYVRMRLDDSPLEPGEDDDLQPFAWGVAIDLDADRSSYELLLGIDGATDEVTVRRNTDVTVANSPLDPADSPPARTYPFATHARVVAASGGQSGGDADFHLELAFPWADLTPLGLEPDTRAFVWVGSSATPDRLDGDLACHDAQGGGSDPDLDGSASDRDPIDPDVEPEPGSEGSRLEGGGGCSAAGAGTGVALVVLALALPFTRRRSAPARTPA